MTYRNFGILTAIMMFACVLHLLGATYATVKKSRGEVLLFKNRKVFQRDAESSGSLAPLSASDHVSEKRPAEKGKDHTDIDKVSLCWDKLTFNVKTGKSYKRLLHDVDGWIEHGTLTALMVCV
jgi:ATP-binding cassette subfamily G (WHITE) protein 2 (PDR)